MIYIKSPKEIEKMRVAGAKAAETLCLVGEFIKPGITTDEINTLVHEHTLQQGGVCAPLNYKGSGVYPFPKSVCTSINNVVCHGIPDGTVLKDGDIVNVDVTTIIDGWHGDTNATFFVGTPSAEAKKLVEVTRKCLELGIAEVKPGKRLGDIGAAIQEYVESQGYSVVRDFGGHGIGKGFHEDPWVRHFGTRGAGIRLQPGMTFTIEPMVNTGTHEVVLDQTDHWTVRTADGSLSAQFEHTLLVTSAGVEILTARPRILQNSEQVHHQKASEDKDDY